MSMQLLGNWTEHDVVVYYKGAANKIEEIENLADLTGTNIDTIIDILSNAGVFKGKYHICGRCGHEFPSIYKKMKNPLCPDCREVGYQLARKEWKLKQNIARMAKIELENAKLRKEIEEMKNGRRGKD